MKIDNYIYNQNSNKICFTGNPIKHNYIATIEHSTAIAIDNIKYYSEKYLPKLKNLEEKEIEVLGVQKGFKSLKEGVTFSLGNQYCTMSIPERNVLWLRFQNKNTGNTEESIFIQNNQIAKTDTKGAVLPEKIEFFKFRDNIKDKESLLKTTLEQVDFIILKLRKTLNAKENSTMQTSGLSDKKPEIIEVKTSTKETTSKNKKPFKRTALPKKYQVKVEDGKLRESSAQLVTEIISTFNDIHEILASIKNSRTRNLMKYSYDKLREGVAGSKVLDFQIRHPNIKSIAINMVNDHLKRHLVITTKKILGADYILVITPDNKVYKTIPFGIVRDSKIRKGKTPLKYYTQDEIDSKDFDTTLNYVKFYLNDYRKHLQTKIETFNKFKEYHQTNEIGSISEYSKTLSRIHNNLTFFVENFKKLIPSPFEKTRFKRINDIDYAAYQGKPVKVYLNEITPNRKSVYIKYSDIKGKKAVQILVHDKGKVEETYSIIGDKMIKFKAKHLGSRPHFDRETYYYTQNEISQSGFGELLNIIERHLSKVLASMKNNC